MSSGAAAPAPVILGLAAAFLLVGVAAPPAAEAGWGARKKPKATAKPKPKPRRKARRRPKRKRRRWSTRRSTGAGGKTTSAAKAKSGAGPRGAGPRGANAAGGASAEGGGALARQADQLLAKRRWPSRAAIKLMRKAVASRDMAVALRLAQALAAKRRVPPADLVDAATILGQDQRYPVQLQLWQRVGKARRVPSWLRRTVDEGWFDALMAAGKHAQARAVLKAALRRARVGTRRSLYERLVAWGRVAGELDEARETLLAARDPDAAVLAARLVAELDGEDAGVALLRRAFKRYPGHRGLQKALIDALVRQGDRAQLAAVVARVVKLAPGDPMPWLKVVDAHILARDKRAARKLMDTLLARYRRHDVLIEALIDREQRLGEDHRRLTTMFEALVRANPKNPSYLEAYGEWLLTRGRRQLKPALAVLRRLRRLPGGPYEGMRRTASILQAHGYMKEAEQLLLTMQEKYPKRPETGRLLAILYGQTGRRDAAERGWLQLIRLPEKPDHARRQLAADARRSLMSLYRKAGWLAGRQRALGERLAAPTPTGGGKTAAAAPGLGEVLLYLDMVASEAELSDARLPSTWLASPGSADLHPMARRWRRDPEVAEALARAELRQGRLAAALRRGRALAAVAPDRARGVLVTIVQRALQARKLGLVAQAEASLLSGSRVMTSELLRLGDLHLRAGDTTGASALYRRAAAENPRDTRAISRLARMFRQRGQTKDEAAALRSIVMRTVDADELNRAGQRLLTLAMGSGTAADLLRWLDAVTPKHPRRAVIERFRLLAYDVWLRTAPLERLLGHQVDGPGPVMLTEAMGSGDLALRVRALRQAALSHRRLPPALARRLLKDESPAIRRLTVLALAASGTVEAARTLVEMDVEADWQVRVAQLLAFAQLPALAEAEPFLVGRLQERNTAFASLAAMTLARVGGPGALPRLLRVAQARSALRAPMAMALGSVLGRAPEHPLGAEIVSALAQWSTPEKGPRLVTYYGAYTALWALAASRRADAREVLLRRAVDLPSPILRLLALRLAGAEKAPELSVTDYQVHLNWRPRERVAAVVVRHVLIPWLRPDPATLRVALSRLDATLGPRLRRRFGVATERTVRARWCASVADALAAAPQIKAACAGQAAAPPRAAAAPPGSMRTARVSISTITRR